MTSTGTVLVAGGELQLQAFGTITVPGGRVMLLGTVIGVLGGPLSLVLGGGTMGGVLSGHGTVDARVVNGGWIEPTLPASTARSGY